MDDNPATTFGNNHGRNPKHNPGHKPRQKIRTKTPAGIGNTDAKFPLENRGCVVPNLPYFAALHTGYAAKALPWEDYALRFTDLLVQRQVDKVLDRAMFDRACLLCSEHEPHFCHRRVALDYLNTEWQSALTIVHLT